MMKLLISRCGRPMRQRKSRFGSPLRSLKSLTVVENYQKSLKIVGSHPGSSEVVESQGTKECTPFLGGLQWRKLGLTWMYQKVETLQQSKRSQKEVKKKSYLSSTYLCM